MRGVVEAGGEKSPGYPIFPNLTPLTMDLRLRFAPRSIPQGLHGMHYSLPA